jgi:hypothetical protein
MNKSKRIMEALAKIQGEAKKSCECGGSGKKKHYYSGDVWKVIPCPKCADIRALDLCCHERTIEMIEQWSIGGTIPSCPVCGLSEMEYKGVPDLTTALHGSIWLVRHWMEVLGVWGQAGQAGTFIDWLFRKQINEVEYFIEDMFSDGEKLVKEIHLWTKENDHD